MSAATSTLTGWVILPDGELVWATSVEITLDETWSPHVQATVVIPLSDGRPEVLDPRGGTPRVLVGIRRAWAGRPVLDELDDAWTGLTLDDLSAEWAGLTLDDLSAGWLIEWDSTDRASDTLRADLAVRGRDVDYNAGTITITAASDELLAQGARIIAHVATQSLTARIFGLLNLASIPVSAADLADGAPYTSIPAADLTMSATVWDQLGKDSGALRLWCDESRTWRLTDPTDAPTTTVHLPRVSLARDAVNLDGEWADVYAVTCHWPSADGASRLTQTRMWPDPLPSGPLRVAHDDVNIDVPGDSWPGPTTVELQARWARLQSTGRAQTLTAPLDPTARPGQAITTGAPSLPTTAGVIAAVTFRVPEDTMTITTRSTVNMEA